MRAFRLLLPALLLALPTAAHADGFAITFLSDPNPVITVNFTLPSTPTVTSSLAGVNFVIDGVHVTVTDAQPGSFNGVEIADLTFYSDIPGSAAGLTGGICITSGSFLTLCGGDDANTQYFSGPVSSPTFTPGTYALSGGDGAPGAITITSTPEPSSLMLLGTGALGLAGAVRRRISK